VHRCSRGRRRAAKKSGGREIKDWDERKVHEERRNNEGTNNKMEKGNEIAGI